MFCTAQLRGARPSSQSPWSHGTHGKCARQRSTARQPHARIPRVVINDIVDIEFKAIVAALELIADALHFLGLTFIPTFSLSQIAKGFEGPILSPDDIIEGVERIAECEKLGGGLETFAFATKLALNDALCPTFRYLYPTSIGPAVNVFNFLTFDPDPSKTNSCGCDPARFPCENDGLCLVANSGYIFLEVRRLSHSRACVS